MAVEKIVFTSKTWTHKQQINGHKNHLYAQSMVLNQTHFTHFVHNNFVELSQKITKLEMWANAQRDGRPAEYRWRPLFNAAVWLTPTSRVLYSNAAKMRNSLKFAGVPQTNEMFSAASGPKFTIL